MDAASRGSVRQPRRRVIGRRRAQRFDQQPFDEARQDEIPVCQALQRLVAHQPHQHGQALRTADMDDRGQEGDQQRRVGRVEQKVAA